MNLPAVAEPSDRNHDFPAISASTNTVPTIQAMKYVIRPIIKKEKKDWEIITRPHKDGICHLRSVRVDDQIGIVKHISDEGKE
jgi:hypothetical protein